VTPSPRDVLARNTIWYGLVTFLGLASGLAMSVVLARGLGPSLMGDFSFLMWMFRTLDALASLGFPLAVVRYSADALARGEGEVARGIIGTLLRWQLVAVSLVATATLALSALVAPEALRGPLMVGALWLVPMAAENVFMKATYGAQRYDLTARVSAVKTVLGLALSAGAVALGAGLTPILIGQALATVLSCALQFRGALSLYPRRAAPVGPAVARELGRYVASLSLVRLLETLVWDRSEIFFLKLWVPSQEIAFYSLAVGLASRAMVVPAIFVGALLPALASLHGAGEKREFGGVYRSALRAVALVGAPIAAVSAGVAPTLVYLLYGDAYAPVAGLYQLLVAVGLLGVGRDVAWAALRAVGDRRSMLTAAGVTAVLDLGVAAVLVPAWGTAGAVAANTVAQVTVTLWAFVALRRLTGAGMPVADLARIGLAGALALLASLAGAGAAQGLGVMAVALGGVAGLGTYLLACVLLGVVRASDVATLMASGRRMASFRAGA
jgi:O-antigen/teichoic acid export membrane protein